MDAETKVAHHRLSILELAKALGNVVEACRRSGMHRSQFYELKKRFQLYGLEGLKDLPPIHKTHPQTTPPENVEKILALAVERPTWGCTKMSDWLRLQGVSVSSPTVQNILIKNGLASKFDRLLALEAKHLLEGLELTPEQIRWIEKANPCFRERHVESSRPGELLCQDTFLVGNFKGIGKVYMDAVVDTYSSYGFGYLHTQGIPEHAALLVHNDVLPFYRDRGITVKAILTDNGREYCGGDSHPYELYLALNDIEHRRTKVRKPQTNGFAERFNRTALDEFFRTALRDKFYEAVEAMQSDFDEWLVHYNTERPHRGYRNMGRRPIDTINKYVEELEPQKAVSV